MLGKLIKYDLKSMLKTMVPMWLTVIALSFIVMVKYWGSASHTVNPDNSTFDLILMLVLFSVAMAIVVLNILFIIQRFWNGLLKEEGYLMFTLPVTTRSLIISKALSALIISLGSLLVAVICVTIISTAFIEGAIGWNEFGILCAELKRAMLQINPSDVAGMILQLAAGVVSFLAAIYQVYASMAIGQLSNRNRFLLSFVAFVGIAVVLSIIASFTDMITVNNSLVNGVIVLITDLVALIVFHVVTEGLLTRKLNLE